MEEMSTFKAYSCLMTADCSVLDKQLLSESVNKIKMSLRSLFTFKKEEVKLSTNAGEMCVLLSEENTWDPSLTVTINVYKSDSLITINMEALKPLIPVNDSSFDCYDHDDLHCVQMVIKSNAVTEKLREILSEALGLEVERISVLKRGVAVPNYFSTSDERVMEYDFNRVIFDQRSKYQRIQIFHSKTLGNALFLDGLQNIADSDIDYTRALMKYGENSYTDKEILILGGGDGGLLHELLKEKPKHVLMVDIDQMVIDACRDNLRKVCGEDLDSLKGENYEVIIGDCIEYLQQFAEKEKQFDYIFNDLTDIPITPMNTEDGKNLWDFVRNILNLSLKCLRKDGKYLNHAIGVGYFSALETYEKILSDLPKVKFSRHSAYVPSFLEEWVFYEVSQINE